LPDTCPHTLLVNEKGYSSLVVVPCTGDVGHSGNWHDCVDAGIAWLGPPPGHGTAVYSLETRWRDFNQGEIAELTDEQRHELPPRFHRPVFDSTSTPKVWLCTVCWGEGYTSGWPCVYAQEHGGEVADALDFLHIR
jgi:hypothetical protein